MRKNIWEWKGHQENDLCGAAGFAGRNISDGGIPSKNLPNDSTKVKKIRGWGLYVENLSKEGGGPVKI